MPSGASWRVAVVFGKCVLMPGTLGPQDFSTPGPSGPSVGSVYLWCKTRTRSPSSRAAWRSLRETRAVRGEGALAAGLSPYVRVSRPRSRGRAVSLQPTARSQHRAKDGLPDVSPMCSHPRSDPAAVFLLFSEGLDSTFLKSPNKTEFSGAVGHLCLRQNGGSEYMLWSVFLSYYLSSPPPTTTCDSPSRRAWPRAITDLGGLSRRPRDPDVGGVFAATSSLSVLRHLGRLLRVSWRYFFCSGRWGCTCY